MKTISRLTVATLGILACALTFNAVSSAAVTGGSKTARPMISGRVNDSQLVTLEGNTNPHAWNKANDRGAVADDLQLDHVMMLLKRSPEQEAALKLLLDQQQTKGNVNYHKWLNEAQFDEAFGVSQRDVAVVVAWLESQGLKVNGVASSGLYIDFSGTAGQVGGAFHTEIHNIQLNTGEKHISNISDPKIPAALAPVVLGPVSLNNFFPHPLNKVKVTQAPAAGGVNPEVKVGPDGSFTGGTCSFITAHKSGASTTCYSVTPGDVATIYNLTPMFTAGYTGKGATIGLIEDSNDYKDSDYATFVGKMFPSSQYGASSANLSTNHPTGPTTCTNPGTVNGTDGEVEIDIEYATAAAPAASVVIESCRDSGVTFGGLIAVTNLVSGTPPPIMSMSYGECEAENGQTANATYSTAFQQAAAKGVSVFVSSGDESSTSCDANATRATHGIGVSGFASTPYNVAVGGTDFDDTAAGSSATYWNSSNGANSASAKSYIPEIPWNDSCASQVIATYLGYANTYGTSGFCNSSLATTGSAFLTTGSGSGGPSNCYSGTPANTGVSNGTCKGQAKPSWQSVYGNPADTVRDIPDVSLFAANGVWNHYYVVCYSNPGRGLGGAPCTGTLDTWAGFGGTSVSSPIMAGIQTLVNQYVGTTTNGTGALQGNPNYVYYALANQEYGSSGSSTCDSSLGNAAASTCVFYDVTAGDMNVNCRALGGTLYNCYLPSGTNGVGSLTTASYSPIYNSTSGWDFATGLGTVNATNLATNWANAFPTTTALTATPTTVASGGTSVLKATVSAATLDNATSGGTQVPIAGSVTFKDGASTLGSCTLASATCSYTTTSGQLTTGTNNITAVYSGSNAYPGSTSAIVVVTVTAPTPDITFSSVTHNFGGIAVGTHTTGSGNYGVQLTNNTASAFAFSLNISGSSAFTDNTNCAASVPAHTSCEIIFIFSPTAAGTVSATWSVAAGGHTFSPSNGGTLTGIGLTGTVSLYTAGHNFGKVTVGVQSPTYGTVLTNGTASAVSLTLGSVTTPFLTTANNCPATLASGASCNLQFAFKPTAAVVSSQVFSVKANGGATPIVTGSPATTVTGVTLVGTGQ